MWIGWRATALFVALVLLAGPARADVPISGTFVANSACPALQSIRKNTNPGGVMLAPRQGYRVVSGNRTPPSHYLLIVPGAAPAERWVAIGCGTLVASGAAPAPTPASPGPTVRPPARTGAPTHFVLALSWQPGFCAGHRGKPECAAESPGDFEATHFTLHGLWPDPREYCGVSAGAVAADKAGHWDNLPAVDLDGPTRTRLAEAMPGTQSLLERHEWLKHGTCSGLAAQAYFSRALDLLADVNASPVRTLVSERAGGALTLADLRAAFDLAFGHGAGDRVRLSCPRVEGKRTVTELTIGLGGDIATGALSELIAAAGPTDGGCDAGQVRAVR